MFAIAAVAAIACGLGALLGYTTCSESGLRWLAKQVQARSDGQISLAALQGCVWDEFTLEGLRYSSPELVVALRQAKLRWEPRQLWSGRLRISTLEADGLAVQRTPGPPEEEPGTPLEFPQLPVEVDLQDLRLSDLTIQTDPAQPATAIDRIAARVFLTQERYAIELLKVELPDIAAQLTGMFTPRDPYPLKLEASWTVRRPDIGAAGKLTATGRLDDYRIELDTTLNATPMPPGDLRLAAHGNRDTLTLDSLLGHLLGGEIAIKGTLNWRDPAPRIALQGNWSKLAWTLAPANDMQSAEGRFDFKATPSHYSLALQTALAGTQIPRGRWTLQGHGDPQHFDLEALHGELLGGELNMAGRAGWVDRIDWDVRVQGRALNPGLHWKEWPGSLNLTAHLPGALDQGKLHAAVTDTELDGKLRGYPLNLQAEARVKDRDVEIKTLTLRAGSSRLQAAGRVGDQMDLHWDLNSPHLGELYPRARGTLASTGRIGGSMTSPKVEGQLAARGIALETTRVAALDAKLALDLAQAQTFDIAVTAKDATVGARRIQSLSVKTAGTSRQHDINTALLAADQTFHLDLRGGLAEQRWSGQIVRGDLTDQRLGHWMLTAPSPLLLSADAASLGAFCWAAERGRWCLEGDWRKAGRFQGAVTVQALPLTLLQPFLAPELTIAGELNSRITASGHANQVQQVDGDMRLTPGQVTFARPDADPVLLKYNDAQLKLALNPTGTQAHALVALAQPGAQPLRVEARLPPLYPAPSAPSKLPIQGAISGGFNDLTPVTAFVPQAEDVKGHVAIDLGIAGTVGAPILRGQVSLSDGGVTLPDLGTQLTHVELRAKAEADRIRLAGSLRSGGGHFDLLGQILLRDPGPWPATLTITGEQFEAVKTPEVWALVAPALDIKAGQGGVDVRGKIEIPEAKLEPVIKAGAVTTSEDIVIVEERPVPKQKASPANVTAQVRIALGDKVSVKTKDFQCRLTGAMSILSQPGTSPTGSGEIKVVDGVYTAYGQKLKINEGRVIFAGGALEDPGLDIEAFREVQEIRAGLKIQGRVSQPELTLYSKPTMNQDAILSYILFGRPLNQLSGDQGSMLLGAASALGGADSDSVGKRIADTFGLDEVKVTEGSEVRSTGLQIGKYLSPGLYLSYGASLMETIGRMNLRYELTKSWVVQVEAGTRVGADLMYSMER